MIFICGCCDIPKRYIDAVIHVLDVVFMNLKGGEINGNQGFINGSNLGSKLGRSDCCGVGLGMFSKRFREEFSRLGYTSTQGCGLCVIEHSCYCTPTA